MADITQKLGFDAQGAITNLSALTNKLNEANGALTKIQKTAAGEAFGGTTKSLDKAKKKANELTVSWKTMLRVVQTQIVVRGIQAAIQTMKEAVESARQLGLAIAEIQTISGQGLSSGALTKEIIDLSATISSTPLDLAEGLYQTLSNQVVKAGEALKFTAEASKLATITTAETADAVNALSSVMNSYGLAAEQTEHIAGTLFKTVELGRLRLSEIANVIGRVTPLTAEMGITWEETAASIAVMTRQGVRADTAITQLRAVVSKLLKPTKEMNALYRKWGVQDGKQAVETFGGLRGVLLKLTEETGGSSAEMAELFRRIRAIVGQMSLMTDNGKLLADAMDDISEGTKKASQAWDEFIKSDAHILTLEMQKFSNETTKLGTAVVPALGVALSALNTLIEGMGLSIKQVFGIGATAANEASDVYRKHTIKNEEAIETQRASFAQNQRERFKGLTEAMSQYYAVVGQKDVQFSNLRDTGVKVSTAVLIDSIRTVSQAYEDGIGKLKSLSDSLAKAIESNDKGRIQNQEKLQSRRLKNELEGAKTNNAKIRILQRSLNNQEIKAREAISKIDASPESKNLALQENKKSLTLSDQLLTLKKIEGSKGAVLNQENKSQRIIERTDGILELSNKRMKSGIGFLDAQHKASAEGLTAYLKLEKERKALVEGGDLSAEGPLQANAEVALAAIDAQMKKILGDAANGAKFLKSLGLETGMGLLQTALSAALDDSHKDWKAEVDRLDAELASRQLKLSVALDLGGESQRAAQALGRERPKGGDVQTFQRGTSEEAKKALNDNAQTQQDILDVGVEITRNEKTINELMAKRTKSFDDGVIALIKQVGFHEAIAISARRGIGAVTGSATKLNDTYRKAVITQKAGLPVGAELIQQMETRTTELEKQGVITANEVAQYTEIHGLIRRNNSELKERDKLKGDLLSSTDVQTFNDLVHAEEASALALKKGGDAAGIMKTNLSEAGRILAGFPLTAGDANQSLSEMSETANSTATHTASIGTAAAGSVAGVASLATEYERLAAAKAKAASAGGGADTATPYHGGPLRYYADGGPARGQDNIPAMLSRGETVINSKNSKRFYSELNAMNQGSQPVYREQGGSVTNVGDVNVTVKGGETSQQTAREIGHALRREVQRGNVKLR